MNPASLPRASQGASTAIFSHTQAPPCMQLQRTVQPQPLRASTLERAGFTSTSGRELGEALRRDFPVLNTKVNGHPLVYFDNAATSQKPVQVLQAMEEYYEHSNSNVHRGVHFLAGRATAAYEGAREKLATFLNASTSREVVYTKNATEGINLVAYSWGMSNLKPGDEILCSVAEHHSNLVPWQLVAQRTGAKLRHVPIRQDTQEIDMDAFHSMVSPRTKLVAMVHVSNMTGAILPTQQVVEAAQKVGARVLLDCCQSTPHMPIDVQQLGADWIVGSGHKMCGPTGIGFLWGRQQLLDEMPPFQGGGEMIENVYLDHSTYGPAPCRFEAGTPMIAEAIGLGAAVDYLSSIGMENVHDHERELGGYLYDRLSRVKRVQIYGPPASRPRAALCAFNVEGIHATDISMFLDQDGVAVRSGHHCTQPLHHQLSIGASSRASLYIYNTAAEVDKFIESLESTIDIFD